jgi:tetratricopeptide (TPR) repeat protein
MGKQYTSWLLLLTGFSSAAFGQPQPAAPLPDPRGAEQETYELDGLDVAVPEFKFEFAWRQVGPYLSKADRLVRDSMDAYRNGKIDEGVAGMTRATQLYILEFNSTALDRAQAHFLLGIMLLQQRKTDEGLRSLESAADLAAQAKKYELEAQARTLLTTQYFYGHDFIKGLRAAPRAYLSLEVTLAPAGEKIQMLELWARLLLPSDPARALGKLTEAATMLVANPNPERLANPDPSRLRNIRMLSASACYSLSRSKEAETYAGAALRDCGSDQGCVARTHAWLGDIFRGLNRMEESFQEYELAAQGYSAAGDELQKGMFLRYLGDKYRRAGQPAKAAAALEKALTSYQTVRDQGRIDATRSDLAYLYREMGNPDKAAGYENAIPTGGAENKMSPSEVATLVANVMAGATMRKLVCQTLMDAGKKYESQFHIAQAQQCFAALAIDQGQPSEALQQFALASSEFAREDEWAQVSTDTLGEGIALDMLGRDREAESKLDTALQNFTRAQNASGQAEALNALGELRLHQARYREAMAEFQKAWTIAESVDHRRLSFVSSAGLAGLEEKSGNIPAAAIRSMQDIQRAQQLTAASPDARLVLNIALLYLRTGSPPKAREYLAKALEIAKSRQIPTQEAECELAFAEMDPDGESADHLKRAGELAAKLQNPNLTARVSLLTAKRYAKQRQDQEAQNAFTAARNLAARTGAGDLEAEALAGLAALAERTDAAAASKLYDEAIARREQIRVDSASFSLEYGLGSVTSDLYDRAIDLSLHRGELEKAFELSERGRSRAFLDRLYSGASPAISRDPATAKQERELDGAIRELEQRVRALGLQPSTSDVQKDLSEAQRNLKNKNRELYELWSRLDGAELRKAKLRAAEPMTLSQIQEHLPATLTVVSYYLSARVAVAFIIGQKTFRRVPLPAAESRIEEQVQLFLDLPDDLPAPRKSPLWDLLIAPVRPFLQTPFVAIVPHGQLHYLAFPALRSDSAYFGDQFALFNLPSVSAWPLLPASSGGGGQFLGVSASRVAGLAFLELIDEAIEGLKRALGGQVLVGDGATPDALRKNATTADQLVIIAHGALDSETPLYSRLQLAPAPGDSGSLTVKDVFDMRLKPGSAVALVGCETNRGVTSNGDDILGLNMAFLGSGAGSVAATSWPVMQKPTLMFLERYMTELRNTGCAATAMQKAQAETRDKFPRTADWAAFTLTGHPGTACFAKEP